MKPHSILITGGAGYIGSHVAKSVQQSGLHTIAVDNLSRGNSNTLVDSTFIQGDIGDANFLESLFEKYKISAVMHFAAYIDVGESMTNPLLYYHNNVSKTLTLLQSMIKHGIKTFIFSSSAAVYGHPSYTPLDENHPCNPINSYGRSKKIVENFLHDFDFAYGMKSCCLRYFNAAGGDPLGKIKFYQPVITNLIPLVFEKLKTKEPVAIYGNDYPTKDGTCIRDFIHIDDIAAAHVLALYRLLNGAPSCCYNLGSEQGFSVREVIEKISCLTQTEIPIQIKERRQGDPPLLVANAKKAKSELNWQPQFTELKDMLLHAWWARNTGPLV